MSSSTTWKATKEGVRKKKKKEKRTRIDEE